MNSEKSFSDRRNDLKDGIEIDGVAVFFIEKTSFCLWKSQTSLVQEVLEHCEKLRRDVCRYRNKMFEWMLVLGRLKN